MHAHFAFDVSLWAGPFVDCHLLRPIRARALRSVSLVSPPSLSLAWDGEMLSPRIIFLADDACKSLLLFQ